MLFRSWKIAELFYTSPARDCGSELLKAVGTADQNRLVKSFEVSSRWLFPLCQWYGMGVCCIPSLALIRRSSSSPMARHGIRSRERARVRVNEIFALFNFRRCARATKIKQREKLKGEIIIFNAKISGSTVALILNSAGQWILTHPVCCTQPSKVHNKAHSALAS